MNKLNKNLFQNTIHSPNLISLVGAENSEEYIDFCFIANPYYPSDEMLEKIQRLLPTLIRNYPRSDRMENNMILSKVLGVEPNHLIICNGSTEIINNIVKHIAKDIGIPIPTFGEYLSVGVKEKVKTYQLSPEEDYQLDLNKYRAWLKKENISTAVIINPGNPTGQTFTLEQMHSFLDKSQDHLEMVIVDESFIDFAHKTVPTLLHSAFRYPNLIIIRSMSKHCGVPGIRLGYLYSHNISIVKRIVEETAFWNLNSIAEYYLSLLPETDTAYHNSRFRIIEDMEWLYQQFANIPYIKVYPSGANFLLIKIESNMTAFELQQILFETYKMYVRDCTNKTGMDDKHIRICTQGREKDAQLVHALQKIFVSIKTVKRMRAKTKPHIIIPSAHHDRKNKNVQYIGDAHLEIITRLDAIPIIVPSLLSNYYNLDRYFEYADGILFTEGEDISPDLNPINPDELEWFYKINEVRDKVEYYLMKKALSRDMPILAICRGMQLLNITMGGNLYSDVHRQLNNSRRHINLDNYDAHRHTLNILPNSWLANIYGTTKVEVNSYHHQGIKKLGDNLVEMAHTQDGLIEAIKYQGNSFAVGVQYHPERNVDEHPGHLKLFEHLIENADKYLIKK